MFNLLKVEGYKLKKFQLGYIAILFFAVVGYLYGDNRIGNKVFEMTDNTAIAFSHVVCDNSFVFIIAIVTALFIGKDFSNRTICNEIKLGHSRFHILLSRTVKPVIASADSALLNRVIQNLISNGVKYTSGDMFFHLFQKKEQVTIVVSNTTDTNVDVTHIFDRFYTQDKSRSKGSGIGLYICRQFIEAMGGSICAEVNGKILSIKVTLNSALEEN